MLGLRSYCNTSVAVVHMCGIDNMWQKGAPAVKGDTYENDVTFVYFWYFQVRICEGRHTVFYVALSFHKS